MLYKIFANATRVAAACPLHANGRTRRRSWCSLGVLLCAAGALACASVLPAAASARPRLAHGAASPLRQGLDFYRGKTIVFIVPTTAGAQFDTEARAITAQMASYLHASINVEDIAAGASIPGQDTLAAAPPDGLTIGMFETGTDLSNVIQELPGLNFNPAREVFLGGPVNPATLVVTTPSSGFSSFALLQKATVANPARVLLQTTSATNIFVKLFLRAFGIDNTIIYGYANSSAIIAGFERGDGNFIYQNTEAVAPLVQAGKAVPVAQDSVPPKDSSYYGLLLKVPTIPSLGKRFPPKTALARHALTAYYTLKALSSISIGAPTRTPSDRVEALRAAIKYALTSAALKAEFNVEGNPVGYVDGPTEKAGYVDGLNLVNSTRSILGIAG